MPRWLRKSGRGWMTAEYAMLPASTGERTQRAVSRGRPDGRTVEIQRLIGRALRSVCDFEALGERTLWLDCDVLQADGGTRCASITGAWIAARRALDRFGLSKALTGLDRRRLGRHRGRRGRARPRLRGGLERRDGHERRHDRRRAARRGAGDRRARPVLARAARRAARSRGGRDRGAHGRAGATLPRRLLREPLACASSSRRTTRTSCASFAPRFPTGRSRSSTLPDEPVEDGATFLDNARIKARHGRAHAPADAWVAGEDSGHRGRRARRTARRRSRPAGPRTASRSFSLELDGQADRRARYVCELVVLAPDGDGATRDGNARRARSRDAPSGERGLRLRPDLRPGRRDAHRGRARNAWKAEHSHRAQAARALARAPRATLVASAAWTRRRRSASSMELSSQITAAVVLDADGAVLASSSGTRRGREALGAAMLRSSSPAAATSAPRGAT